MEITVVLIFIKTNVMAEITTNPTRRRKGSGINIKIDLTPMVDLGFLLITFFVFTTTMSQSTAMNVIMPNDKADDPHDDVCESCALTILPAKNNGLFYFEGMEENAVFHKTNYGADGLRKLIADKKSKVKHSMKTDRMILIIKPTTGASFKNIVDIIDESTICMVKKYYLAELSEAERKIVE